MSKPAWPWRWRWRRFSVGALLTALTAAAVLAGAVGWQVNRGRTDAATLARLSKLEVTLYRSKPSTLGWAAGWLPDDAQVAVAESLGKHVLTRPRTVLATQITPDQIDQFLSDAQRLSSLKTVVVMEYQLDEPDVRRLRLGLPGVKVVRAAFISGAIAVRVY